MRMPTLKGWLEACFGDTTKPRKLPMNIAAPTVEVDAELADLIPQYLSNRWSDLAFARQLQAKADFYLLSRMAHRIRGSAASYGFGRLGDIAQALEAAAEQRDPAAVDTALENYDAFLRSVRIDYI
jgi:HPt (histidine-containing phosphotransfer) domain-containing protein